MNGLFVMIAGLLLMVGAVILLPMLFVLATVMLPFLIVILGICCTIFWIWMMVDCIRNQTLSDNEKVLWVLAIVFTHFIGAAVYFFAGRNGHAMRPIS